MEYEDTHTELKQLIEENIRISKENNKYLRKLYRNDVIGIWIRVVWFVLLVGLPFALYFYVLEPYFTAMGSSYETFSDGMQEIPGWKQFTQTLEAIQKGEQ